MKKELSLLFFSITCSIHSADTFKNEHTIATITLQQIINILHAKSISQEVIDSFDMQKRCGASKSVDLTTRSNAEKEKVLSKLTESDLGDLFEEGEEFEWCRDQSSGNIKIIISQDKYWKWIPPLKKEEQKKDIKEPQKAEVNSPVNSIATNKEEAPSLNLKLMGYIYGHDMGRIWNQTMYNEMRSCLHLDSDDEILL